MRFLVDANLPRLVVPLLRSLGHRVEFARDIGLAAAPDRDIAVRARLTRAALLTRDLFRECSAVSAKDYPGQIVLRLPDNATADVIAGVIERFVREPTFLAGSSAAWPLSNPIANGSARRSAIPNRVQHE